MSYVEYLRVRRAIIVYTIIVGGIAALTLLVAFTAHGSMVVSAEHSTNVQFGLREMLASDFAKHGTKIPLSVLFVCAGFGATILATVFGKNLCSERDHTPLAWTKPASREAFALSHLGVDALGIVATFVITLVFILTVIWGLGIAGFISADSRMGPMLAMSAGIAFAFYGVVRALTVGFPSRGGAITGASWAVGYVLVGLSAIPLPQAYHAIIIALNFLNPLAYLTKIDPTGQASGVIPLVFGMRLLCVWLLAVITGIIAIAIYRRAEA
jgi:hypothetical protein